MGFTNSSNKQKLIILGVDGTSYNIIESLMAQGKLPTLKDIIAKGVLGKLTSTVPPSSFVAWSSCFTGKNPAKIFNTIKAISPNNITKFAVFMPLNLKENFVKSKQISQIQN